MATMMRIAVVLVALFVFAALLVVDTGGILGLIFSWAISGPAYRWMLLSALLVIVALYCVRRRQKRPRVSGRAHSLVAPARSMTPATAQTERSPAEVCR